MPAPWAAHGTASAGGGDRQLCSSRAKRCVHSESTRAPRLRGPPGRIRKRELFGDKVQTAKLDAVVPADPAVARPALQRRRREHHEHQPSAAMVSDIAHGLAHPRHRAEIVVRPHQVPEAGLIRRRRNVAGHLRKSHCGFPAPTTALRYSCQSMGKEFSGVENSLSGLTHPQSTNPPCPDRASHLHPTGAKVTLHSVAANESCCHNWHIEPHNTHAPARCVPSEKLAPGR